MKLRHDKNSRNRCNTWILQNRKEIIIGFSLKNIRYKDSSIEHSQWWSRIEVNIFHYIRAGNLKQLCLASLKKSNQGRWETFNIPKFIRSNLTFIYLKELHSYLRYKTFKLRRMPWLKILKMLSSRKNNYSRPASKEIEQSKILLNDGVHPSNLCKVISKRKAKT